MPSYGHYVSDYLVSDLNKQKMLRGNCNEFWNYILYNSNNIKDDMKHQQSLNCKFGSFYTIFKKWHHLYVISFIILAVLNLVLLLGTIKDANGQIVISGSIYSLIFFIGKYVYLIFVLLGISSKWVYHSRILLLSKYTQSHNKSRCSGVLNIMKQFEFIIDALTIIFIVLGLNEFYIFYSLLLLLSALQWKILTDYLLSLKGVAILIIQAMALILIFSVIASFIYFYKSTKCSSYLDCGSPFIFKVFMWFTGGYDINRENMDEDVTSIIIANIYSILSFIVTASVLYGAIYSQVHLKLMDVKENIEYCIVCGANRKECSEMWEVHSKRHQLIQYVLLFLVLNEKDYEMTSMDAYLLSEIRNNSTKFLPFNKRQLRRNDAKDVS